MTELTAQGLKTIAEETLTDWLPGFVQLTDSPDDEIKITWLGDERFQVQTDRVDPGRIFSIRIACTEER